MVRTLYAAIAAISLAGQVAAPLPPAVRAGTSIERGFESQETHSYDVALSADDFLSVVVEQRGVDVNLRLQRPDSSFAVESDSLNGAFGFERIAFVSPINGVYRIVVRGPSTTSA